MPNLIRCLACGKDVSDAAPACPGCGQPIAQMPRQTVTIKQKPANNWGCAVVLLVLLLFFIGHLLNGANESTPAPVPAPAGQAMSSADCHKDLSCTGEKLVFDGDVLIACKHQVDAQATNDSKWDDGILSPFFSKYGWVDKPGGNIILFGDRVQFQNGIGNFLRMTYACTVDPETKTVLSAEVSQGKLSN